VVPVWQGALTDRCRHAGFWEVGVPAQRGVDLLQLRACLSVDQGHGTGLPVQVIAQLGIARDHGGGHLVHVDGHGLLGERRGVALITHALILPWLWGEWRGLARTGTPQVSDGALRRWAGASCCIGCGIRRLETNMVRQRHRQVAPWPVVAPTSVDTRTRGAHVTCREVIAALEHVHRRAPTRRLITSRHSLPRMRGYAQRSFVDRYGCCLCAARPGIGFVTAHGHSTSALFRHPESHSLFLLQGLFSLVLHRGLRQAS